MSELVHAQQQPAEVTPARADTDSWVQVVGNVARLAEQIASTDFVPRGLRNSSAAVTAAILYGREVGLPPMTSLTQTHVIEGKPAMSAEAMRGLVLAAGHEVVVTETTGAVCRMKGRRRNSTEWTEIVWTLDMARAAGVANKQVWKSYPRAMLQARATTELVRLVFPDVIHGFRSIEELDDMGLEAAAEAPAVASGSTVQRKTATKRRTTKAEQPAPEQPAPVEDLPPLPDEPEPETPDAAPSRPAASVPDGEEVAPQPPASSPSSTPEPEPVVEVVEEEPASSAPPKTATQAQQRMLFASLKQLGVEVPVDRYRVATAVLGREVSTYSDLSRNDVSKLIDTLAQFRTGEDLMAFLDQFEQAGIFEADVVEEGEQ